MRHVDHGGASSGRRRGRAGRAAWVLAAAAASLGLTPAERPGDQAQRAGVVEERVDRATRTTITTLLLVLRDDDGPLPINMTFTALRRGTGGEPPERLTMEFDMRRLVGGVDATEPHLMLVLDGRTSLSRRIEGSFGDAVPLLGGLGTGIIPLSTDRLDTIGSARTIEGRILGIEFRLPPEDIVAIGEFAGRVRRAR